MKTQTSFFILRRLACAVALTFSLAASADPTPRVWINKQGRSLKATFVGMAGNGVILRLENGTQSTVPLADLSDSDQAYVQSEALANKVAGVTGPLAWPAGVVIDPKSLTITEKEQKPAEREFAYESGSFRFVSKAPLTGTVMKEIAGDFELTHALFMQLPWNWQPKPQTGDHFLIYLTETNEDYIALGGTDDSGAASKDGHAVIRFSTIGLKKVGPRYAYDARMKGEGEVVGMTSRLVMGEIRNLTYPWSGVGMETMLRTVCYHNGGFQFTNLENKLKAEIQDQLGKGQKMDLDGLVAHVRSPNSAQRSEVTSLRRQAHFNGMLLTYYFSFLEGDGKGTAFHQYWKNIAAEALGWRKFRETQGKSTRPRSGTGGSYADWAKDHLEKLLTGRTDEQLKADIEAKFKSINVKFGK